MSSSNAKKIQPTNPATTAAQAPTGERDEKGAGDRKTNNFKIRKAGRKANQFKF